MIESLGLPEFWFLVRSLGWTIVLTLSALAIGASIGGFFAIARVSHNRVIRNVAISCILVPRIAGVLVLFLAYFGLAYLGFDPPALVVASLALGLRGCREPTSPTSGAGPWSRFHSSNGRRRHAGADAEPSSSATSFSRSRCESRCRRPSVFWCSSSRIRRSCPVVGHIDSDACRRAHRSEPAFAFIIYGTVALLYFSICFPLSQLSKVLERKVHAHR